MDIIKATSEETMNRLKEVTGGKFEARFGAGHEKWPPERNLLYVTAPFQDLIDQYQAKVGNCQQEIDDAHTMLKNKQLDIEGLRKEGKRFLSQNQGKTSWDTYEVQLARERITA